MNEQGWHTDVAGIVLRFTGAFQNCAVHLNAAEAPASHVVDCYNVRW
jgi:hypothetical protein